MMIFNGINKKGCVFCSLVDFNILIEHIYICENTPKSIKTAAALYTIFKRTHSVAMVSLRVSKTC